MNDGTLSGKSLDQLVQEYGLSSNLFRLRAVNDSRLIGKTIIDLDVRRKYGLNIIEVRRVDSSQHRFLKNYYPRKFGHHPIRLFGWATCFILRERYRT